MHHTLTTHAPHTLTHLVPKHSPHTTHTLHMNEHKIYTNLQETNNFERNITATSHGEAFGGLKRSKIPAIEMKQGIIRKYNEEAVCAVWRHILETGKEITAQTIEKEVDSYLNKSDNDRETEIEASKQVQKKKKKEKKDKTTVVTPPTTPSPTKVGSSTKKAQPQNDEPVNESKDEESDEDIQKQQANFKNDLKKFDHFVDILSETNPDMCAFLLDFMDVAFCSEVYREMLEEELPNLQQKVQKKLAAKNPKKRKVCALSSSLLIFLLFPFSIYCISLHIHFSQLFTSQTLH